jgi:type II secretory pathway pseudopilin PulG
LLVLAIMGVLAAIAVPRLQEMIDRARVARAIG